MDNGHPNGVIQLVEIRELEALRGHDLILNVLLYSAIPDRTLYN